MSNTTPDFFISYLALAILGLAVFAFTAAVLRQVRQRERAVQQEKLDSIREHEQKYDELLNTISDIVFSHTLEGDVLHVNEAAFRTLGFTTEELVGHNLRDLAPSEKEDRVEGYLATIKERMEFAGARTIIDKSGNPHVLEFRNRVVLSEDRVPIVQGIARDVTEERMATEALSRSEERYRRFFEEDLTGDFIVDGNQRIIACNPAFADIFGFESVADAIGESFASLFDDPQSYHHFMKALTARKKLENFESRMRRRDGSALYVIENVSAKLDDDGNVHELRGYIFDNTDRKLLEDRVLQMQKMESVETLAGGIAHDFNNILGIILGHVALIEEDREASPEQNIERFSTVHEAIDRGTNLVNQILTFAKRMDAEFGPVHISSLVRELGKMLQETFPEAVKLNLNLEEDLPFIQGDPHQLHRALLNLSLNARDAIAESGEITISAAKVQHSALKKRLPDIPPDDYVEICVSDNGEGMDEETLKRLYEPFFTTKLHGQGTGLGLSVVYGIVMGHDGQIHVESKRGKGTTFFLYFPALKDVAPAEKVVDHPRPNMKGSETVLIVEDEHSLVNLLSQVFKRNGYEILVARDGEEAVEVYRNHQNEIDLVFTDAGLPKMNGYEVFWAIYEMNPDVNFVFASGYFDPEEKERLQKSGMHAFIQKPYSPVDVVGEIREILNDVVKN